MTHTGDNRTGEGDGDDEQVVVDFSKIPAHIHRIGITVTIYDEMDEGRILDKSPMLSFVL